MTSPSRGGKAGESAVTAARPLRARDYVRAVGPGVIAGAPPTADPTTWPRSRSSARPTIYELGSAKHCCCSR